MAKRILSLILSLSLAGPMMAAGAFADSARAAHAMLTRLCDDFGGRLTGSAADRGAMEQLAAELRSLGLQPETVPFTMPGWERGADKVELIAPLASKTTIELRSAAARLWGELFDEPLVRLVDAVFGE